MKKLEEPLINELRNGCCVPAITKLAKKLKQPGSTIHFNIKKMEKEGKIVGYKAIFDYSKINRGFTGFALVKLDQRAYHDLGFIDKMAARIVKNPEVESVDDMTGDWELLVKIRAKDHKEYLEVVKRCLSEEGIVKVHTLVSLKQYKSEYMVMP